MTKDGEIIGAAIYTLSEAGETLVARTNDRGFSSTVKFNGRPVAVDTRTVSAASKTLTQLGGPAGQRPTQTIVYDRH